MCPQNPNTFSVIPLLNPYRTVVANIIVAILKAIVTMAILIIVPEIPDVEELAMRLDM